MRELRLDALRFSIAWTRVIPNARGAVNEKGLFFFKRKAAYELGLGIPAEPLFRSKLLEEILSFRMQGVEFDNGDMYVDGHKAASDVRDEFVSVTEKLMDELAQCYNVLPQLDINNTIDHRPEGDEKWFL